MNALRIGAAVILAALVAGCAGPSEPGGFVEAVPRVQYYPACGNETLEHEGVTWYPIEADWSELVPVAMAAPAPATAPATAPAPAPAESALVAPDGQGGGGIVPDVQTGRVSRVAAPGPGDDVGSLWIYEGGFAFFRSDSGDLETWLTTEEQTYNWVC